MKPNYLKPSLFIFLSAAFSLPVNANPTAGPPFELIIGLFIVYLLVVGFLTAIIEYGIAHLLLKKYLEPKGLLRRTYLLMHVFTFPLTQILAFQLFEGFRNDWTFFAAELLPVILEFGILFFVFKISYGKDVIIKTIPVGRIFFTSFLANLITFLLGLGVFALFRFS